jgi:hypothetical protein
LAQALGPGSSLAAAARAHQADDQALCLACLGLGASFSVLTFGVTGRFLMSL